MTTYRAVVRDRATGEITCIFETDDSHCPPQRAQRSLFLMVAHELRVFPESSVELSQRA